MRRKVSIILPCYNEAGHICDLVRKVMFSLPHRWECEVVVVDDNSPDGTYAKVAGVFAEDARVIPVLRTADRGLAKSIRAGLEYATGDQIVVMDSDFTHDPGELAKLLHVGTAYDIVIGSRFCPGGAMQNSGHYAASMFFNWFLRCVIGTQIQDNLGGYFTMRADKLRRLPFDLIFFGYGDYFFRLLHFAQREGLSVVEVPARYVARRSGTSKSRHLQMLWTYSLEAARLRMQAGRDAAFIRAASARTGPDAGGEAEPHGGRPASR